MIETNQLAGREQELEIDLPWTNIQVDSQVLSTFMSCPQKADYVFNQNLVPVSGLTKSIERGQLTHVGLHAYWKGRVEKLDYQKCAELAIDASKGKAGTPEFKNLEYEDELETLKNMVEYFKFIQALTWTPLAVEQHFRFIAYEDKKIRLRIILTGRIDLIFKTPDQRLVPTDHKTEAERWFYSVMSNQFKIYALACKTNIIGVQRIGFQKTLEAKDKFKMELLTFDPDILEEFRTETLPYWCKELLRCKQDNYWPMNTTSCVHGHFKCQFSDAYNSGGICGVSRAVRKQKLDRYFTIGEPWDPSQF